MITNIATVTVYVDNQDVALRFWIEQVGFNLHGDQPMGPQARWIEVGPENAQAKLVLYPKAMMPNWQEQKASIVFACDDVQQTYDAMVRRGVEFAEPLQTMPWGTFGKFRDPEGNEYLIKG